MATTSINYKKLSEELDEILMNMQSDDLDIDEAMKLYERGAKITKALEKYLQTAENKINKIKADFSKS